MTRQVYSSTVSVGTDTKTVYVYVERFSTVQTSVQCDEDCGIPTKATYQCISYSAFPTISPTDDNFAVVSVTSVVDNVAYVSVENVTGGTIYVELTITCSHLE